MIYDVIIVGGGAAGLTAAVYTTRRALKTLVIAQDIGGQAATTPNIENYPGFLLIDGFELMQTFYKQAEKSGAEFIFEEVKGITKADGHYKAVLNTGEYSARAIILAFGLTHRHLGVPGEERLIGRGVSYCATCDAPLYKDKEVAVVGGGNSALDAALLLSKIAKKVYLIHRRGQFSGEHVLTQRLRAIKNIEFHCNAQVKEIKGEKVVESLLIESSDQGQPTELPVNGLFVEIGFQVKGDLVKNLVSVDDRNQIIVTNDCSTSVPGIFAAGDVTNTPYKQVVISAGEGAKAALQVYKYLTDGQGSSVSADWGNKKAK